MQRRTFLASMAATLASAAGRLPASRNVRWALSASLWFHYPAAPFTDILDVMRDTGFIGVRLTGYPGCLKTYKLTATQMEREVSRRNLHVCTISFGGPVNDTSQHQNVVENAKEAMRLLQGFGARHLVVFPPGRVKPGGDVDTAFRAMCTGFNRIGEAAGEMGFQAGVHNYLDQMVQGPDELDRCMSFTDTELFHFSPDTGHLHLGGSDVVRMYQKYKYQLVFMDYKDACWTTPMADLTNGKVHKRDSSEAEFFESIYDLGDGDIDFPGCHRVLKEIGYKGWNCVDFTRNGPRASYEHSGRNIVERLETIYA